MQIGEKIRDLRKAKHLTLEALSQASRVAIATISRIENGKMMGTLDSHMAIAKALGLNLPQLYSDIEPEVKKVEFQSEGVRSDVFLHPDKASYEILTTSVLSKKMMPILLKIEIGGKTTLEQAKSGTEKFIFVISGSVEVEIESKKYILNNGDSLYFDGALPHFYKNIGKNETKIICVTTPPML
ncbi:MAG: XRE family transcriptional regulator [Candidatus Omnitrophica bacterium]|nr:XRE family transcriptional regulator [Candidatus Omnitrophota bacterium]